MFRLAWALAAVTLAARARAFLNCEDDEAWSGLRALLAQNANDDFPNDPRLAVAAEQLLQRFGMEMAVDPAAAYGASVGMRQFQQSCNAHPGDVAEGFCLYGAVCALWIIARHDHTNRINLLQHANFLLGSTMNHVLDFMESSDWPLSLVDIVANLEAAKKGQDFLLPAQVRQQFAMPKAGANLSSLRIAEKFEHPPIRIEVWELGVHASLSAEPIQMWARILSGAEFKYRNLIQDQYPQWLPDKCQTLYWHPQLECIQLEDEDITDLFRRRIPNSATSKEPIVDMDGFIADFEKVAAARLNFVDILLCTVPYLCLLLEPADLPTLGYFGHPLLFMVPDDPEVRDSYWQRFTDMGKKNHVEFAVSDPFLQMQFEYQLGSKLPAIRTHALYTGATHFPQRTEEVLVLDRPHEALLLCTLQRLAGGEPQEWPLSEGRLRAASSETYPYRFITRALTDKTFSSFAQFRAVVLWPYDMDLITFYEFYGMNMPLFMPAHLSKYLFHQDHDSYNYRWGQRPEAESGLWPGEAASPFEESSPTAARLIARHPTEERCCVRNDPACWDEMYTRQLCCGGEFGNETRKARGDPSCWMDGYSYEECCKEEPKHGCWDSNFAPARCCVDKELDPNDHSVNVLQLDFSAAFARAMTHTTSDVSDCQGRLFAFWHDVKRLSTALNMSHTYGQVGQPPTPEQMDMMLQQVLRWTKDSEEWERDSAECPEGAIAAIDLTVSALDRDVDESTARAAFALRQGLAAKARPSTRSETVPWRSQDLVVEHVPRLLGLEGRHSCHGSSLRIFMYRLPEYSHMLKPVLKCSQKMSQCSASVHLHRWLERGSCLTDDPDTADLFFFPAYEACYNETSCAGVRDTERCFPDHFDPIDLPYFSRRGGQDHIFVFACNLLPFMDPIMMRARNTIMITVESYQAVNVAGPNMLAWLVLAKDVLIPGYIPAWRVEAMLAFNRPMYQRSIVATFHGHSSSSTLVGHMYKRSPLAEVRDRIIGYFGKEPQCSAGPPVRDYFRRSGLSRFCLIPAGLTAWTIHLYEAFFFGCVPVILSDEVSVPFQEEIDWPSLSLKVPTSITMEELHGKLLNVSMRQLKLSRGGLGKMSDKLTAALPMNVGFSDYFRFPGVQHFESIPDLLRQLPATNFFEVVQTMSRFNHDSLVETSRSWRLLLKRATGFESEFF
ncbi:unnamed protein product [Effrenium voratum]|uniref:Exostosin GT47 domain-containing protein n=1 Tax=Effrenium voratum TaxID=2562239 RepID=A0AA36J7R4_9DINO|nr:unnamed protein product [Effrenium voratum]